MSFWLTVDSVGKRSQTTLAETRIGTDSKAPGTPQSQVQNIKETKGPSQGAIVSLTHWRASLEPLADGLRP